MSHKDIEGIKKALHEHFGRNKCPYCDEGWAMYGQDILPCKHCGGGRK